MIPTRFPDADTQLKLVPSTSVAKRPLGVTKQPEEAEHENHSEDKTKRLGGDRQWNRNTISNVSEYRSGKPLLTKELLCLRSKWLPVSISPRNNLQCDR
jgi:hypothetical protein